MTAGNTFLIFLALMLGVALLNYLLRISQLKKARRKADSFISGNVSATERQIKKTIKSIQRTNKKNEDIPHKDGIRIEELHQLLESLN